jgi:hypothetical protein
MKYIENVYWQVGDQRFTNKFDALVYSSETKQQHHYVFYDSVWNNFDKTTLGNADLDHLYKLRALQLRGEYDYLVLYFSGGADSYNVLRTFIDNNIKLDEVCVKWPMVTVNKELYTPNTRDKTAFNYLSEWDYAIKPVLDWLKTSHPEIKIEISDWSENFTPEMYTEENIKTAGVWNDVEVGFTLAHSKNEKILAEQGKKVASIYGIDKPIIGWDSGKWFISFEDSATGIGIPMEHSKNTIEYFYWTPKLPAIVFEQSYKVCCYVEKNPEIRKFFPSQSSVNWTTEEHLIAYQVINDVTKSIIYTTWDNKFQVNKPTRQDRTDKQAWIFSYDELAKHRDTFVDMNSEFLKMIHPVLRLVDTDGYQMQDRIRGRFRPAKTKWHFVKNDDTPLS